MNRAARQALFRLRAGGPLSRVHGLFLGVIALAQLAQRVAGGLEGGLVLFLFLLQSFLTSTGFFSFTACGFGTFLGGAALLFLADAGFLGAAGLFSTGALLSLRTGAGFGGGLFLGGAAGLSGFGFSEQPPRRAPADSSRRRACVALRPESHGSGRSRPAA